MSGIVDYICRDELFSYNLYKSLVKKPFITRELKNILLRAAEDEYKHYLFWKSISSNCKTRFSTLKILVYTVFFYLFGLTILLKYLESKEKTAIEMYKKVVESRPELAGIVEKIIDEELKHEEEFISGVDEARVRYIGAITLGISDALVELTGIYTGSLGAFENTLSAGLTGILAGIAASISMGVASYTQAKNEGRVKPWRAALYTFTSYITVALLLALPYLLSNSILLAFIIMLIIAIGIVAYMSFYTAVLYSRNYVRELAETTLLLLGVSIILYVLGSILGETLRAI